MPREGSPTLQEPVFPNRILRAKSHPHFPRGQRAPGQGKYDLSLRGWRFPLHAARGPRLWGFRGWPPANGERETRRLPRGESLFVRHEASPMIVQEVNSYIRRTCGSVRSSLSAPARLATAPSEAAETRFPPLLGEKRPPRGGLQTGSVTPVPEIGWVARPTQVNCYSRRQFQGAKDADRLSPKTATQPVALRKAEHADTTAAGGEAGAKPSVSSDLNMVNLTPCLHGKAGRSARRAAGVAGRGGWKKRTPPCNGADRSQDAPPRKRADFQRVMGDGRAGRTTTGGNRK